MRLGNDTIKPNKKDLSTIPTEDNISNIRLNSKKKEIEICG